jgi:hypothetical protein
MPATRFGLMICLLRFSVQDKSLVLITQGLADQPFHGRIAVLVNEWTNSAGEMVAQFAKDTKLATVIREAFGVGIVSTFAWLWKYAHRPPYKRQHDSGLSPRAFLRYGIAAAAYLALVIFSQVPSAKLSTNSLILEKYEKNVTRVGQNSLNKIQGRLCVRPGRNFPLAKLTIGDITASEQIDITDDSLLAGQKLNDMQSTRAFLAALGKPVTDKTFNDVALAATFENSTIPFEKNTVDFKAGVNALISVARASDTPLFGKDDYDAVDIVGNDCWVGVEFDTLLDAKVSVPLPQGFGVSFEANTTAAFATYQLVPDAVALNEKLGDALSAALSAYNVMATAEQVMKIPAG